MTSIFKIFPKNFSWKELFFSIPILGLLATSAIYVAHGDILYDADIARDFLLLQEILEKKFILIGPRSGAAPGFFHGPLWSYLNFPAFYLGGGNPVAVGWFWVLLNGFLLLTSYLLCRKYLGKFYAFLLTALIGVQMIGWTRAFFNPSGALILIPTFLGTLLLFIRTKKILWLFLHAIGAGLMIQFQIAIGAPLLILSFLILLILAFTKRIPTFKLLAFIGTLIPLASYVAFDIRHNFSLFKAAILYISGGHSSTNLNYVTLFLDRIKEMGSSGTFFLPVQFAGISSLLLWATLILAIFIAIRKKDYLPIFFAYFYVGFYALSLIQRGGWGVYYYFPLFPVAYLLLVSVGKHLKPFLFIPIIILIMGIQFKTQVVNLSFDLSQIGQRQMSWQFHNQIAKVIFASSQTKDFGFFLYSPDIQGYRSKYPIIYQQKLHPEKTVHLYEKLPVTFLLFAGPPEYPLPWKPDSLGFKIDSLEIKNIPSDTWHFKDGYTLEKVDLTQDETAIPFDQNVNNWLHFR